MAQRLIKKTKKQLKFITSNYFIKFAENRHVASRSQLPFIRCCLKFGSLKTDKFACLPSVRRSKTRQSNLCMENTVN